MLHCSEEIIASCNAAMLNISHGNEHTANGSSKVAISGLIAQLEANIETAKTILYCIQHQQRVVDDVLTLSKLDSDLLAVSLTPCQPIRMIQDALKMFGGELKKADITLIIYEDSSLDDLKAKWAMLDPSRVLQVFINLMTNAIKFTRKELSRNIAVTIAASLEKPSDSKRKHAVEYLPTQSRRGDASVSETSENIYISFSVADTGRGLDMEERKALFHRFAQANPKTYTEYGGSGLGLFISRQIAEMLGGAIGVASERGQGSTFAFFVKTQRAVEPRLRSSSNVPLPTSIQSTLEALAVDAEQSSNPESSIRESSAKTTKNLNNVNLGTSNGLKTLVVEDNLVYQKVVSKQLLKGGFQVVVANHGEEALSALQKTEAWRGNSGVDSRYDLILMDLEMPVMGGINCVKLIRKHEADGLLKGHVPVIAVTANVRSIHLEEAINAGMDDVTTKPYRMDDLVKQIAQHVVVAKKT